MLRKTFIIIFLFVFFSTCCYGGREEDKRFKAGLMVASKVEEEYPVSKEEKDFLKVNGIGLRLVSQIKDLKYPYTFTVIKMEDANAFALPGGFVYVTTGLLDLGLEDSELAFVLAHEIAHNELDHIFKLKSTVNWLSALMIAVEIFAMTHTSPTKDAKEVQAESAARSLAYSLSGAMVTSGYSREFEKEADFWGRVYLAKAGFDTVGSRTALEKIDILKRRRPDLFSSLLMTHPYILDRLYEAEEPPITFSKDVFIKENTEQAGNFIQNYLLKEAENYANKKDKKVFSLLLYRNAYFIYPEGRQADMALYEMVKNREEIERKKKKFLVDWNFLIKNYEKLLKEYPASSLQRDVTDRLKTLKRERDEVYKWYEGHVGEDMSLDYYSNFVNFFPESPLVPKARYFLAKQYVSSEDYDKGLNEFVILAENSADEWGRRAKEETVPIIDKSTDIVLLGELLNLDFPSEVKNKINARLKKTIPQVKELESLNKFSVEFPASEHKALIAKKKNELAEELYIEARAQSLSGNWYKTVTIYRQILKYAPDSPSAEQIRQEFTRLEQLRREGNS